MKVDWGSVRDISIMSAHLVAYLIVLVCWGVYMSSQEVTYTLTLPESFYCYVNSGKGCPAFFADIVAGML